MKQNKGVLPLLALLVILATSVFCAQPVSAAISQEEQDYLTESLQILSSGWNQEHVNRANNILSNPAYSEADWQAFFFRYFDNQPLTDPLQDYLRYPVIWWFDDGLHLKLQNALVVPLQAKIGQIVSTHRTNLGQQLAADANLNQSLFNAHRFLNIIQQKKLLPEATRTQLYSFYTAHINAFPEWWKNTVIIEPYSQPYVAAIRAQMYMNLGEILPLTPAIKTEIAQTVGLTGQYRTLWDEHGVLVIDNHGADEWQLTVIANYLTGLPKGIHTLRYITINDFLGNTGQYYELYENNLDGVNIFSTRVGTWPENGFPEDVVPLYADIFSMALAHEVNHIVDVTYQRIRPGLAVRRQALIDAAGTTPMNYLRSMFEEGFFTNAPQEFFASIANQWFASSAHTFELALVRWANGYKQPINQFLFFAEVYSQGEANVPFYSIDEQGQMKRQDIAVKRDSAGRIIELTLDKTVYQFSLGSNGDVSSLSQHLVMNPTPAPKPQNCQQKPAHSAYEHGHDAHGHRH